MRKTLSFLLVAVIILSMSISAFAAPIEEIPASTTADVKGSYNPGVAGGTVFSVEIEWSGLSFTYNGESKKVWDPDTLEYTGEETPAGWAESNATITVKNRSNTIITATPTYDEADGYTTAGMDFIRSVLYVDSAEPTGDATVGEVKTGTICVTPTGTLPENTQDATIGTITVSITEFEDITELAVNEYGDNHIYGKYSNVRYCAESDVNTLAPGTKYITDKAYADYINKYDELLSLFGSATQDELNARFIEMVSLEKDFEIFVKE